MNAMMMRTPPTTMMIGVKMPYHVFIGFCFFDLSKTLSMTNREAFETEFSATHSYLPESEEASRVMDSLSPERDTSTPV